MGMAQKKPYRRRDKVIVQRGRQRFEGRVEEVHGKGLVVITENNGKRDFYRWCDVVGPAVDTDRVRFVGRTAMSTFGDVMNLKDQTPEPIPDPPKPPKVLKKEPPSPKPERPRPVLVAASRSALTEPITEPLPIVVPEPAPPFAPSPARPRARKARHKMLQHEPTPIGSRFRAERLKLRKTQAEFSVMLGIRNSRLVSLIELGDEKPDDDLLLKFSEVCHVSLDEVLSVRAQTSWYEPPGEDDEPISSASTAPTNLPGPPPLPLPDLPRLPNPFPLPDPAKDPSVKTFRLLIESTNAELVLQLMHSAQELGLNPKLERK